MNIVNIPSMRLERWLQEQTMTQDELGKKLNPPKTQGQISHYITGHTPIPIEVAIQIEAITKGQVTVSDWVRSLKRERAETRAGNA